MNVHMLIWQKENTSLKALWKLPQDKFVISLDELADYICWVFSCMEKSDGYRTLRGTEMRKKLGSEKWVHGGAAGKDI